VRVNGLFYAYGGGEKYTQKSKWKTKGKLERPIHEWKKVGIRERGFEI
jgi:hypothetical protein